MSDPDPMALLEAPFAEGLLAAPEGRVAALRARPSPAFAAGWDLLCEQGFRPDHDALAAAGREVSARLPEGAGPFAAVLVVATRAREETQANVARAWDLAAEGAPVLLAGARGDGIDGHRTALRRALEPEGHAVEGLARAHGRVLWTLRRGPAPAIFADWRAAGLPRPGPEVFGRRFVTVSGGFSHRKVDAGSRLLAETLPPLAGRVADLGAGWGLLAAAVLRAPEVERLDLVEAEAAALDCARANLADDPRAAFHWADARASGLPEGAFDAVVTNPPFHAGRAAEPALGAAFFGAAARLLSPRGALYAVANRTLPYERPLREAFGEVEEIGPPGPWKLFRARRPLPRRRAARA